MYYARYQDVNVVSYELCQVPRKTASAQGDANTQRKLKGQALSTSFLCVRVVFRVGFFSSCNILICPASIFNEVQMLAANKVLSFTHYRNNCKR